MAIQQAYETVGNPDARAVYDQRLARAGVKVEPVYANEESAGWISTRNIIVAGLILVIVSGGWVYHARQKAREEREVVERLLRIAEEDKRRQAEIQAREEERRQAQFEAAQARQTKNEERQFRQETENWSRRVSAERANAERQDEYQRQREQSLRDQKLRQEQYQQQAQDRAAQQRLQNEKRLLRETCLARYNRPDC
jgi:FtsZ-interacting cell division protein ZipA